MENLSRNMGNFEKYSIFIGVLFRTLIKQQHFSKFPNGADWFGYFPTKYVRYIIKNLGGNI